MKSFIHSLYVVSLLSFNIPLVAQTLGYIAHSPLDTVPCNVNCHLVHVDHLDIRQTTSYADSSIPYNPITIVGGTPLVLQDDTFSAAIPIGFDFCFYEHNYNQLYASSNGQLTFNALFNLQSCSPSTQQTLPYYSLYTFPDNAIFLPFVDLDISQGGTITYTTIGTAPFRKFVIAYSQIPFFGNLCPGTTCSFQCVLNETWNSIDLFITNKPLCNSNPQYWVNKATIGVQSIGAGLSHALTGKNAEVWAETNQGYKIYPNGNTACHVNWYNSINTLIQSNTDTLQFCATSFPKTIHAQITFDCSSIEIWDTITLIKQFPILDSIKITPTSCANSSDGALTFYGSTFYPPLVYAADMPNYGSSNYIGNLSSGSHLTAIKDAHGCVTAQIVSIPTVSTLNVSISIIQYPTCPNSDGQICATISGGVPPYVFWWTSTDTNLCFVGIPEGSYVATVMDATGCAATGLIELQALNKPVASEVIHKPICYHDGSIDLTVVGGTSPYTYSWSPSGDTTQDLMGITQQGNYSVTITDAAGCTIAYTYYVEDTLITQAYLTIQQAATCGLPNGTLHAAGYNAVAPYSFLWSNGDTTALTSPLAGGWYSCIVTDALGCSDTDSILMPLTDTLALFLYPSNAHCDSVNSGAITTVLNNATGPVQYTWSTGDTTQNILHIIPNTYTLSVVDSIGCLATDSATVDTDQAPFLVLVSQTNISCYGDSNGAMVLGGIGGLLPYKYSFNGSLFDSISQINHLYADTFTVSIRDGNYCIRDTEIIVTQPTALHIDSFTTDFASCHQDSSTGFQVWVSGATPPYEYRINGGPWQTDHAFKLLLAGTYYVEIKDSHDCFTATFFDLKLIHPNEELTVTFSKTDLECYHIHSGELQAAISGGVPPYTFSWNPPQLPSLQLTELYPGEYSLEASDSRGCKASERITLEQLNCCPVIFPNAFSPNGDMINDRFKAFSAKDIGDMHLQIYNRWGNCVFSTNRLEEGWDGTIQGVVADNDTYFYLMEYWCNQNQRKMIAKGDFTLVR